MLFNSEKCRVAFEPGDTIRCKNADDAGELADIFCQREIPFEFIYNMNGKKGIWITVLPEEEADEQSKEV